MFKKEIRILGIDDSPFKKFVKKDIIVIGTIFRGGYWLEGILSTKVRIDGNNSTKKLIKMINKCKFKPQLRAILLDGIAVGGFNIIDIKELNKKTNIPVIVVVRRKPDVENIKKTLLRIGKTRKNGTFFVSQKTSFSAKSKIKLLEKAGNVEKFGKIYCQYKGLKREKVEEILKITCTRSLIPEPIRTAHIIAAGLVLGESKGRA